METKELIGFRTIKRGDETVRIPVYKKKGTKDFIQKSIKHPGRCGIYSAILDRNKTNSLLLEIINRIQQIN